MVKEISERKRNFLILFATSIIGGGVNALAFPKFDLWFFIPVSFAIFFIICSKTPSIFFPFIYGFTSNIIVLYWLVPTMRVYGDLSLPFSIILCVILCSYLSIYHILFLKGVRILKRYFLLTSAFLIPAMWVFLELIKGRAFSGFPWELTGYAFYKLKTLIQISDITGIYGLSFMGVLSGLALYDIINWKEKRKFASVPLFISSLSIMLFYGNMKLKEFANPKGEKVKVALIQGNFEQDIKWNPFYRKKTMDTYFSLSEKAIKEGVELIIWPETAVPFFYQSNLIYRKRMKEFVKKHGITLIFGSPAYSRIEKKTHFYNRIFLINSKGEEFFYDKIHLVPFGEYVPVSYIFGFAERFFRAVGNMTSGKEFKLLKYKSHLIGGYICYEAIFPELVRIFRKKDAELLVNITNDAWFGKTSAPYQHLSMAILRSVENRAYTVRVANTGISAVITPSGEVLNPTQIFTRTYLVEDVKFTKYQTFYSKYGDVFAYTLSVLSFLALIIVILFYPR